MAYPDALVFLSGIQSVHQGIPVTEGYKLGIAGHVLSYLGSATVRQQCESWRGVATGCGHWRFGTEYAGTVMFVLYKTVFEPQRVTIR